MTDPLPSADTAFGRRVRERLRDEQVIWLITTGADGTPQPNPVWYVWEEPGSVLIFNRPDAHRLQHVAARPQVSLHFDGNGKGGDVVVLAGSAQRVDEAGADQHAAYVAKYDAAMARVSGSAGEFASAYPVPLRVTIGRVRGF
jgi:PPOX class probable F420-dependent enzyme